MIRSPISTLMLAGARRLEDAGHGHLGREGRARCLVRGYGVRKLGGNARADADTVFPIASVTKAFNATVLAMLVDEGRVQWTDPVIKHIPEFQLRDPWITREVTLADCLAHRTGLADPDLLSYSGVTRASSSQRMRFLPQVEPFRTGIRYNNKGIIVVGEVIERVSGQSWSDFVRKWILQPLDMTKSVPDVLELTYPKFLFGAGARLAHSRLPGVQAGAARRVDGCLIGLVPEEKLGVVVLTNLAGGIQTVMMHDAIDRVLGFDRTWSNREFIDATNGVEDRRARRRTLASTATARRT